MLINELSKKTGLTKKAIEYYIEQNFISPEILDNGYRCFCQEDLKILKKIYVLRKIGLSINEIKKVFENETGIEIQRMSVEKELLIQREKLKKKVLDELSCDDDYNKVISQLDSIDKSKKIIEKLMEVFPSYYGNFICLHFARFLNEPIETRGQEIAYLEIVEFLDNIPKLDFSKELRDYLEKYTKNITSQTMVEMNESTKKSIEDIDQFLKNNKAVLEQYFEFKKTEEYKASTAYKMQNLLKDFMSSSGYYDLFIPAMRKLSNSYNEYCDKIKAANDKIIDKCPELKKYK